MWIGLKKQLQSTRKKRNLRNQKETDEQRIAKGDTFSRGWWTMRSRQREKTEKEQRTTIQIARWRTRRQEWRLCHFGEKQGEASAA